MTNKQLDTNPSLTQAPILTLSIVNGSFDHFTCRRRYINMVFNFGSYIYAP